MAKLRVLTEQEMLKSKNRFKKLLEYSFVNKDEDLLLDEDDDENPNQGQEPAMGEEGQEPAAPEMGGEGQEQQPQDGGEMQPQGQEMGVEAQDMPLEAQPMGDDMGQGGEEIELDVTDLATKQNDVDAKVSSMADQTEKMMSILSKISDKVENIIQTTDSEIGKLKDELIKRNPTPVEVLQKRITVSDPFSQTPAEYWEKKQAEGHYRLGDDTDDAEKEYELKSSDLNASQNEVYRSFGLTDAEMNQSLATMFR